MTNTTTSPGRILTAALAIGCLFDLLFYGKLPGLSVLLFVLAILSALTLLARMDGVSPARRNLWILVPLIFFAAMVAVRSNGFLLFLDIAASIGLLALLAYFYAAGRIHRLGLVGYYIAFVVSAVNSLFRAVPLVFASVKGRGMSKQNTQRLLPVLRGLLIALPVAVVFILLLASADIVFARYVTSIFSLQFVPDIRAFLWQVVIALSVAWVVAGGLVFALTRLDTEEEEPWETAMSSIPTAIHIGFTEGATVLVVVDLIFLLFGWIQLSYLFGGQDNITVDGFTYADYARRGFFELLAVSILTMGLILSLHWLTWRETGKQAIAFRLLSTLMAGLTLLLLASAFFRMSLYEEAYGYTHLRLFVHLFEIWLALLFGWLMVTLWLRPRQFAIGFFVAALGFLVTINLSNPDALIAEQNIARYAATGKIDSYYLAGLSEDATPALLAGIDNLHGEEQSVVLNSLQQRLERMNRDTGWQDLASLNLSRWSAYDALTRNQVRLAQAKPTYPQGEILAPADESDSSTSGLR